MLTGKRTQALKKKKEMYILDLLSVVYDFEEKKKAFLISFFEALIISCSFSPKRLLDKSLN